MKIGDEVYVHGYVDEIRGDTIIIRNSCGYFGTDVHEVWQIDGKGKTQMDDCKDFADWEKEEAKELGMGDRIKQKLEELGMSQWELAKKVKITEVSLSRYINGDRTPKGPIISSIARALGVTSDWLLGM